MNGKFNVAILLIVVSLALVCYAFLCPQMPLRGYAIPVFTCCAFLGVAIAWRSKYEQRKKLYASWREQPYPVCCQEFDDFFWDLSEYDRDWYFEEILTEFDREQLTEYYLEKMVEIWHNEELEFGEKVDESGVFYTYAKDFACLLEWHKFFKY